MSHNIHFTIAMEILCVQVHVFFSLFICVRSKSHCMLTRLHSLYSQRKQIFNGHNGITDSNWVNAYDSVVIIKLMVFSLFLLLLFDSTLTVFFVCSVFFHVRLVENSAALKYSTLINEQYNLYYLFILYLFMLGKYI